MSEQIEQLKTDKAALVAAKEAMRKFEQRRDLTWTTNDRIWMALHGPRYAAIQKSFAIDTQQKRSYLATIGNLLMPETDVVLSLEDWGTARRCETLEEAQAWAAEKLGAKQ